MDSFFRDWIRSSGIGFVFQGLDWFFREWILFQGTIGLSGTGLVFKELDAMIF